MASPQITLTDPAQWLKQQTPARPAMGPPEAKGAITLTDPGKWLQQDATDHSVRDHLQNEGFLDSAWNVIKSPFSMVSSLVSGDWAKEGEADRKRMEELQKNGTPEQKREFAKEILLKNIPGASTVYKAAQGNIPGALGDVAGMATLGVGMKAGEATVDAAGTIRQVVTNPEVARAALDVVPKGQAIGKLIDKVQKARGAIKPKVNDYAPSFTEPPIQATDITGERAPAAPMPESFTGPPIQASQIIGERTAPGPMPESFTGAPVQASEILGERTAPAALAPVVESPGMALARESGQDWATLSPADQALLEQVAKAQQNTAAQPPRPPMGPPEATAPTGAPIRPETQSAPADTRTLAQMMQDELAARRTPEAPPSGPLIGAHPANPPVNGRGAPLRPPLQSPTVRTGITAGELRAEFLRRKAAQQAAATPAREPSAELLAAEDDMMATPPAPGDPQPGRSGYTVTGERKSPQLRAVELTKANINKKAARWAEALHAEGITAEDVSNIKADADWGKPADGLTAKGSLLKGEGIPNQSRPLVIEQLKKLEGNRATPGITAEELRAEFLRRKAKK